jgi:gluconate 5-dehydrogenase
VASAFDVTDQDQVRAGIDAIEANVGPIEILVNNACLPNERPVCGGEPSC